MLTFKATKPKARRQYRCDWCGETIEINEKHSYWVGLYDGGFTVNRMHLECAIANESKGDNYRNNGFRNGDNRRGEVSN